MMHISQKPITATTDATVQAETAMRVWEYALKEALGSYNWGFAKVIETMTVVANYTPLEYAYAYTYPSTAVRVWFVYADATTNKTIGEKFRVIYDKTNGVKLVETNIENAYAEYTQYLETVTLYDPYFVTAFAHRLAAELAVPLNGDAEMAKEQIKVFNTLISEAHRFSEYERQETRQANTQSSIITARG